ncbi:Ras-like protein enriched in brain [Oopsacas minuta]|uniref:Ras-like protein enriched in brain n=1 Tax=Oopsacas minuta TaxID=111878 RepID=A0AAV7JSI4_9METZ|nr:Ras-like protein enriched in brain [Oopsacas minuta]
MMSMNPVKMREVAIMGMNSVGKSSLTFKFVWNSFQAEYNPTITDRFTKELEVDHVKYACTFIDTAGQDDYSIFPSSCSSVHGFILVYSINSRKSFDLLHVIRQKIVEYKGDDDIPLVIVGNKRDLEGIQRAVQTEEGRGLSTEWNASFFETSAKEDVELDLRSVFTSAITEIERKQNPHLMPQTNPSQPQQQQQQKDCVII